ncbi:Hypothetical_protein [Hexamita inflata]|uniref:Hypothetical_protein n=1 Tax=Hexamita inflata TaxID=28002 RepID=A0AA86P5V9_9EUKA|nr:Hypothetical protein HINF_LOCUS19073 [Hexamita inflata]
MESQFTNRVNMTVRQPACSQNSHAIYRKQFGIQTGRDLSEYMTCWYNLVISRMRETLRILSIERVSVGHPANTTAEIVPHHFYAINIDRSKILVEIGSSTFSCGLRETIRRCIQTYKVPASVTEHVRSSPTLIKRSSLSEIQVTRGSFKSCSLLLIEIITGGASVISSIVSATSV